MRTWAGVLDLAAAGAGQVAAEERLEHQHERVALAARELLLQDVAGDRPHLRNRHAHANQAPSGRVASSAARSDHSSNPGNCPLKRFALQSRYRPRQAPHLHRDSHGTHGDRRCAAPGTGPLRGVASRGNPSQTAPDRISRQRRLLSRHGGFRGTLDPTLQVGDVVLEDPGLVFRNSTLLRGTVYTADHVVATPADKAALFQRTQAQAVDMESTAVRSLAAGWGIPFVGLRAISDAAGDAVNPRVMAMIDDLGRPRLARTAAAVLRRPSMIPELLALRATPGAAPAVASARRCGLFWAINGRRGRGGRFGCGRPPGAGRSVAPARRPAARSNSADELDRLLGLLLPRRLDAEAHPRQPLDGTPRSACSHRTRILFRSGSSTRTAAGG